MGKTGCFTVRTDRMMNNRSTIEHTNNLLHDMYPKMDPLPVHTFSPPFTPIFRERVSCCKVSIISKQTMQNNSIGRNGQLDREVTASMDFHGTRNLELLLHSSLLGVEWTPTEDSTDDDLAA